MGRLVRERKFDQRQDDGWHYARVRKLRRPRNRQMPQMTNEFEVDEDTADQPASVDDLAKRIRELEQEGVAQRATVRRLQDAGKTVIA